MVSLISIILWWNSRLSPPIGFLANLWFLWMVLYRTPKEMQKHSRILLQTCVLDIIFLAISLIGIPLQLESNGFWLFLHEGLFFDQFHALFGTLGAILHAQLFYSFTIIETISISLQFVYRFLLLNHNFQIGLCRYSILLVIPFLVSLCIDIYFFIDIFPLVEVRFTGNLRELFDGVDLNEGKFYYYTLSIKEFDPGFIIISATNILTIIGAYAIITFCGVKMVKFVSGHTGFSETTKRLNKQLTKTLIILSFLPLFLMLCGLLTMLNVATSRNLEATPNNLIAQGIVNQFFILLPVLNPLVGIATNTPYRYAAMFWRKRKVETKPPVVVQNPI